ncbi:MAG: Holliday junction branch migration protein RuvA [Rhodothermales bacterium]
MITYVSGTLAHKSPTDAVIDVQGLGYELLIPASSYEKLPATGKNVKLLTHHYVREDAVTLFGFATEAERTLFRTLVGVSGVGPKLALAALSAMPPETLRDHILEGDASVLTRIPGVGKKTAERLVVELRDRLATLDGFEGATAVGGSGETASVRADARSALESLGFSRADAEKRIRTALRDHDGAVTAEELIRLALR